MAEAVAVADEDDTTVVRPLPMGLAEATLLPVLLGTLIESN